MYAAFLDGRPAGWYRDYKNGGEIQKWVSTGAAPNPEQMAMLRADAAARREQRAAAQADKFDQTANRLMEEYNRLPDATGDLAYLKNKQVIAANGLKADERGNVVIPCLMLMASSGPLSASGPTVVNTLKKTARHGEFFRCGWPTEGW